jgi:hypothetical protein
MRILKRAAKALLITVWALMSIYIVTVGYYVYYESLRAGIGEKIAKGELP